MAEADALVFLMEQLRAGLEEPADEDLPTWQAAYGEPELQVQLPRLKSFPGLGPIGAPAEMIPQVPFQPEQSRATPR